MKTEDSGMLEEGLDILFYDYFTPEKIWLVGKTKHALEYSLAYLTAAIENIQQSNPRDFHDIMLSYLVDYIEEKNPKSNENNIDITKLKERLDSVISDQSQSTVFATALMHLKRAVINAERHINSKTRLLSEEMTEARLTSFPLIETLNPSASSVVNKEFFAFLSRLQEEMIVTKKDMGQDDLLPLWIKKLNTYNFPLEDIRHLVEYAENVILNQDYMPVGTTDEDRYRLTSLSSAASYIVEQHDKLQRIEKQIQKAIENLEKKGKNEEFISNKIVGLRKIASEIDTALKKQTYCEQEDCYGDTLHHLEDIWNTDKEKMNELNNHATFREAYSYSLTNEKRDDANSILENMGDNPADDVKKLANLTYDGKLHESEVEDMIAHYEIYQQKNSSNYWKSLSNNLDKIPQEFQNDNISLLKALVTKKMEKEESYIQSLQSICIEYLSSNPTSKTQKMVKDMLLPILHNKDKAHSDRIVKFNKAFHGCKHSLEGGRLDRFLFQIELLLDKIKRAFTYKTDDRKSVSKSSFSFFSCVKDLKLSHKITEEVEAIIQVKQRKVGFLAR